MKLEEMLKLEYGDSNVNIDYSIKDASNTIAIKILSKDGNKEFSAEKVLYSENYIEIDGRRYSLEDFILALNTSFNKKD